MLCKKPTKKKKNGKRTRGGSIVRDVNSVWCALGGHEQRKSKE